MISPKEGYFRKDREQNIYHAHKSMSDLLPQLPIICFAGTCTQLRQTPQLVWNHCIVAVRAIPKISTAQHHVSRLAISFFMHLEVILPPRISEYCSQAGDQLLSHTV